MSLLSNRVPVKRLFLNDDNINSEYVTTLFGLVTCAMFREKKVFLSSIEDRLRLTKNGPGNFSLKTAWDIVRQKGQHSFFFKNLGYTQRPIKISVLLGKMLNNAIPMDILVQKRCPFSF